ncbi:MAG: c-type cytochrome [bacterium]|nr:c-type cytochrome [bacterium]
MALSLALIYPLSLEAAFDAAETYEKQCSSCHTVGGGDDIGPDLKGISERRPKEWLFKMIRSSQELIDGGDPVAVELFNQYKQKKMPDQDLSDSEIEALLQFIAEGGPSEKPIDAKPATEATPAQVLLGRDYFLGTRPLSNGGPACLSCHSVGRLGPLGGGTLASNLTDAYARYEDKGLSKALKKMGFPVMQEVYANHPLTDDEAFAIKAFLYKEDQMGESGGDFEKKFIFLGLGGGVILLGIIDLSWRKRRRKSTKPTHGGAA